MNDPFSTAAAKRASARRPLPPRSTSGRLALVATSGLLLGCTGVVSAAEPAAAPPSGGSSDLDIDQLVNLTVTSVGKKEQSLASAPAAVFVLTQEDIRRSGATSIPEALRMVPGLEVARLDGHNWAVSSRGFNDLFANKLLVMMDGRSVYTPLFSGVYWDVQDTVLEDLDRIEVVRGPGGSLWGANAVNGVINIISKSAKQTQGGLVSGGGGTEETAFGSMRYGGKLGENTWYRVYGKYSNRDNSALPNGDEANDRSQLAAGGFRVDWEPAAPNRATLQGDVYGGRMDQTFSFATLTPPFMQDYPSTIEVSGANLLGRWTHDFAEGNQLQVQGYYDHTHRDAGFFAEDRNTFDLDAQHRFALGGRNEVVSGLGYRLTSDHIAKESFNLGFGTDRRTDQLFSAFVQDEVTLVQDRLKLTLGSKFEHNDYTGFEVQPSMRLMWMPNEKHSVWAAVSRAVRTPSRVDTDMRLNVAVIPGAPPTVVGLFGSRDFQSEELLAYEIGYRVRPHNRLSFDLTTFYHDYGNLTTIEPGAPFFEPVPAPAHAVLPLRFANKARGHVYGAELAAMAQMADWWQLRAGYTFLESRLKLDSDSNASPPSEHSDPHHQVFAHSSMNLPGRLKFDAMARYVDALGDLGVPSYVSLDLRLAWEPRKNLELALVGQNLLDDRHPEFGSDSLRIQRAEIQRGFYGKITFRF